MSGFRDYSSVAASNTSLFPENMNPSAVNDGMRQVQADAVTAYRDSQWADFGDSPSYLSATTFQISGNVTNNYVINRRIRCNATSTVYGAITDCTFSGASSVITVELDSGNLTSSLSAVALGSLTPTNVAIPKNILQATHLYAADGGSNDSYAITLTPALASYTTGIMIRFKANTANTGAASLNVNSLGAKTIKKNGSSDLDDNDILAGQIVTVIYDGTNFQLLSPPANSIPPFTDTNALVKGSSDSTKKVRFEVDGLTTGTTRVITMADSDVTLRTQYFELIGSATASNSASISVSGITNIYSAVIVVYASLRPATDNTRLFCQLNGETGANYLWSNTYRTFVTTPTVSGDGSSGDTSFTLSGTWGNGANDLAHGKIDIRYPAGVAPVSANWATTSNDGSNQYSINGGGHLNGYTTLSSVLLKAASGNLTSGVMYVYGLRAS